MPAVLLFLDLRLPFCLVLCILVCSACDHPPTTILFPLPSPIAPYHAFPHLPTASVLHTHCCSSRVAVLAINSDGALAAPHCATLCLPRQCRHFRQPCFFHLPLCFCRTCLPALPGLPRVYNHRRTSSLFSQTLFHGFAALFCALALFAAMKAAK